MQQWYPLLYMAERKAVNKYYPPEWEPSQGSLNHYVRRREKDSIGTVPQHCTKAGIGHQDKQSTTKRIRFELPMPIWCDGCGRHVAKNVRFNADKRQVGMYHTTPILQFTMKCPSCPQQFVIETDPKETMYRVLSGAKEKTETPDNIESDKMVPSTSAFALVEKELIKRESGEREKPRLETMMRSSRSMWENDFASSQRLRREFREQKREERRASRDDPVGVALRRYGIVDREGFAKRPEKKERKPFSDF